MLKLIATGHLGADANVNNVNGKTVINFSVAFTEHYKDASGNSVDKTIWLSCGYWTDRTAVANYLKKGSLVAIEGKPEAKTYQDKSSGNTMAQLSVRITNIHLLSKAKTDDAPGQRNHSQAQPDSIGAPDDLPF